MKAVATRTRASNPDASPSRTPVPTADRRHATSRLDRSFAIVRPDASRRDGQPAASADKPSVEQHATRAILTALAEQLGMRVDRLEFRADETSARLLADAGAEALMQRGTIYLDPASFDPTTAASNRLLAHEAAHVAQRLLPSPAARAALPDATLERAAEVEADVVADRFAATGRVAPVRVPLPANARAAKTTPGKAPAPAKRWTLDDKVNYLTQTVGATRSGEIEHIEGLLSYGAIDWAVTDAEVFEVLRVLASFPLPVARAIAANIEPKFRHRLLANLNKPHHKAHRAEILAVAWAAQTPAEFKGIEAEILVPLDLADLKDLEAMAVTAIVARSAAVRKTVEADTAKAARLRDIEAFAAKPTSADALSKSYDEAQKEEDAAALATSKYNPAYGDLIAQVTAKLDETFVTDKEALVLLDAIADALLTSTTPSANFRRFANSLTSKYVDELIDQIPVKGLYASERRRQAFVYLVSMRPAYKNAILGDDLIGKQWWKFWRDSAEDALLAFLLVKSMPTRARQAFIRSFGGAKWSALQSKLPPALRESETLNLYTGDQAEKDKQAILAALLDPELWTRARKDELRANIRMAIAAGEGRYVFEQSRLHAPYTVAGLEDVADEFRLYRESDRMNYVEAPLEPKAIEVPGILRAAWRFIFGSRNVDLDTSALGGEGLNLAAFQNLQGGNFQGMRFAKPSDAEVASAKAGKPAKNFADVRWDINQGRLDLNNCPHLDIVKIAYPYDDLRFTAGPASLKNVSLHMRYMPQAQLLRSLDVEIGEVVLENALLVFPDSMLTINRTTCKKLRVSLKAADSMHHDRMSPNAEGAGHLFSNLYNVVWGDASAQLSGSLSKPAWAAEFVVAFDDLTLDGVATSGGRYVEQINVKGFNLHAGGDAAAYRRALEESSIRLNGRIVEENAEIEALKAVADAEGIKARDKRIKARDELKRHLGKVEAQLANNSGPGSVMDMSAITIKGVKGYTSEKPLTFKDVHGQGRSVTAVLPLFSDSAALRNLIVGEDAVPTVRTVRPADDQFGLDIGSFDSGDKPMRFASGIPTADEAKAEYERFVEAKPKLTQRPGYEATKQALKERAAKAATLQGLMARGLQNLDEVEQDDVRQLRAWLTTFEEKRALVVGRITAEGATITVGPDGQPGIIAEHLLVQNIQTFTPDGEPNLTLGQIEGSGVDVSGVLKGSIRGFADYRANLERIEARARNLTLRDIRYAGTGAVIKELRFEGSEDALGLDAVVERGGEAHDTSVTLKSQRMVLVGVNIPTYGALLNAELERLERISAAERTASQNKRIATIRTMLGELTEIHQRRKALEQAAATTKDAEARKVLEQHLARAKKEFADWETRLAAAELTVDHLAVSIGGLGDVLAVGYDFDKHAPQMSAKGIGDKGQWFSKATLKGARQVTGDETAGGDVMGADTVEFGPMTGDLKRTKTGWAFTGLTLETLMLDGIEYVAGDTSVRSKGPATLKGIAVDLEISEDDTNTRVDISKLQISSISAQQLTYADASVTVTVVSGELEGILVERLAFTRPKDAGQPSMLEGGVDIKRVKSLTLDAVAGTTTAHVSLASDEAALAKPDAKAIKVAFGKAGLEKVDLLSLSGNATIREKGTTNQILVEWKRLSAAVSHTKTDDGKGDIWNIDRLALGSITFKKGSHWEADNAVLDIDGQATATTIFVNASVELRPNDAGETTVAKAFVHGLSADQIDATGIRVMLKAQPAKELKNRTDCEGKARVATKTDPSKQKTIELPHGTINGLKMTGFDLQHRTGKIEILKDIDIQRLKLTIGDEAKETVQKGVISFKSHGKDSTHPNHGGRELSAELRKDGQRIQIGTVEQITGSDFKGPLTAASLATGRVTTGPIDITPCKVVVPDINVASIGAKGMVEYKDGSDLTVRVSDATVTGIRIPYLEAQFGDVPDGKGGMKDGLKSLKLGAAAGGTEMMVVDKIEGTDFFYSGTSREPGKAVKTTEVKASKPVITTLKVKNFERDFVNKFTKMNGELTSANLTGFSMLLKETLGSDTKSKQLFGDVIATGIRADLSLTDAAANGKPWVNGESTFEVDHLGLTKLRYYQKGGGDNIDVEGRNHLMEASATLKGFKARMHPDGTAFMSFKELTGNMLKLKMDGVEAAVDVVKIEEFVLGLRNMTLEKAKQEIALRMKTLSVDGLWANVRIERATDTSGKPGKKWTLDPLAGMNGDLTVSYPLGPTVLDANLPIRGGIVDFDAASSFAYLYPFGADTRGIYVDLPPIKGGRKHLYEPPGNAGITPETYKKDKAGRETVPRTIDSRGAADLKKMLEAALSAPSAATPPANLAELNDPGLNSVGPIRIGAGTIGTSTDSVELVASSTGVNEFVVNSARIGTALQIDTPMFRARRSEFNIKGQKATTGEIEATTMVISINALGSASTGTDAAGNPMFEFNVTLRSEKGVVKDVTWGDIKMFKPDFSGLTSEP